MIFIYSCKNYSQEYMNLHVDSVVFVKMVSDQQYSEKIETCPGGGSCPSVKITLSGGDDSNVVSCRDAFRAKYEPGAKVAH